MYEILIYGPIGSGFGISAEDVKTQLDEANGADVLVRINSAGGGFDAGPAIYNALAQHAGRVVTEVDGIAYSMASVILQAGSERRMAENAVIMVHGAQYFAEGSAEEMRKTAEMMDVHTTAMRGAFVGRGIKEETVAEWLDDGEDHYFTAQQALDAGLVDSIVAPIDLAAALHHIPADIPLPAAIAAYRNPKGENQMPDLKATENTAPADQAPADKIDVRAFAADRTKNIKQGEVQGAAVENKRQNEIRAMFDKPQFGDAMYTELRDTCLANVAITLDAARVALIDAVGEGVAPVIAPAAIAPWQDNGASHLTRKQPGPGRATPGQDAGEKYIEGVTAALSIRTGLVTDREELRKEKENNEFVNMTVTEIARRYLDMHRVSVTGYRRDQIIGQAMVTAAGIAHSTSDFSNILENIAEKAMMQGWDRAPETWHRWARSGTLPDFKPGSRVNLSTFGDLELVHENGDYTYGTFSDLKETLQLGTYGKLFGISRQALADDDLGALAKIPRGMGLAAAKTVGDLAYAALTSNPVLNQDSTAVFDATHNNIGTPGLPDVAPGGSIDEAWTAMGLQTDPDGNVLNIAPQHIIVPRHLAISTGSMLADANFFYEAAAQNRANPFQNQLTVTADARLDQVSTTAWYVLASGDMFDTVEVAFLNGQETPYLESKDGWNTDGVEYKVRIDAVAVPLDFRTMFYNAGA